MYIFAFSDLNKMESLIPVINKLQAVLTDNYIDLNALNIFKKILK